MKKGTLQPVSSLFQQQACIFGLVLLLLQGGNRLKEIVSSKYEPGCPAVTNNPSVS